MMRTEMCQLQQENNVAIMIDNEGHDEKNERLPKDGGAVYRRQCTVENEQVGCAHVEESMKDRKAHKKEKKVKGEKKSHERMEKNKKFHEKDEKRRKLQKTLEDLEDANRKKKKFKKALKEEKIKLCKVEAENKLLREQLNQVSNDRNELLEINNSLREKGQSQDEQLKKSKDDIASLEEKHFELKQTIEESNKKLLLTQKKLDDIGDMKVSDKKKKEERQKEEKEEKNFMKNIFARVCSRKRS